MLVVGLISSVLHFRLLLFLYTVVVLIFPDGQTLRIHDDVDDIRGGNRKSTDICSIGVAQKDLSTDERQHPVAATVSETKSFALQGETKPHRMTMLDSHPSWKDVDAKQKTTWN